MNTIRNLSYRLTGNSELFSILLTCAILLLVICLLFRCIPAREQRDESAGEEQVLIKGFPASRRRVRLSRKDLFLMCVLTGMYAVVSLHKLGSNVFPVTTWQPSSEPQTVILELSEDTAFDAVYAVYCEGDNYGNPRTWQLGFTDILLEGSHDGKTWSEIGTLNEGEIYEYMILEGDWDARLVRITVSSPDDTFTEIGFKAAGEERFLPVRVYEDAYSDSKYPAALLVDEQDKLTLHPTYYDMSYFDEIYHARNAAEIASGQLMYTGVHPFFGTSLIALAVKVFGLNPFGWRIMGVLTGIAMMPLMYLILRFLLNSTFCAAFGTLLLGTDFMHLTTSRIGTLEPFSVFGILLMYYFMMRYYYTNAWDTPLRTQLLLLLACGISFGFAGATKWTAFYSAAGLAVIFFVHLYKQYRYYRRAKRYVSHESLTKPQQDILRTFTDSFGRRTAIIIALCFVFFIFLPTAIYFLSYIPTHLWRDGWSIHNVIDTIKYIFTYHTGLDATHPYQSVWYQWLLDLRPIWYYIGADSEGLYHTIACFSNPLLCWAGVPAIIYTAYKALASGNRAAFLICIGYLSALLPWIAVERCVFAYHFYPTSVFMIMAIAFSARDLCRNVRNGAYAVLAYAAAVLFVFVLFLPATAGFGTGLTYIHFLEWFPSWYFG